MELLTECIIILANTATLKQTLCYLQEQTATVDIKQHLINSLITSKCYSSVSYPQDWIMLLSTKVCDYNDLMSQHFVDNESVIVIDTVPLE